MSELGKHKHWLIWGYDSRDGDQYQGIVQLDYIAVDLAEAMGKARADWQPATEFLRGGYLLRSVVEHFDGECSR